jgi:hypothetical protein
LAALIGMANPIPVLLPGEREQQSGFHGGSFITVRRRSAVSYIYFASIVTLQKMAARSSERIETASKRTSSG